MRNLILFVFITLPILMFSQKVTKVKTESFCYSTYSDEMWSKWSDVEQLSVLIVINLDDMTIKTYNDEPATLDIVKISYRDESDAVDNTALTFNVVDEDGIEATVIIYKLKNTKGYGRLFITYPNSFVIGYSIYWI